MKDPKKILLLVVPLAYFFTVWFFPWHYLEFNSTISVIYLFDLTFVIAASIAFKALPPLKLNDPRRLVIISLVIIPFASLVIWISNLLNIFTPFGLVERPALQLLLLAPLVEELVFRHGMWKLGEWVKIPKFLEVHYNSALFAISHLAGIWVLPVKYYPFICYQIIYTYLLGRICAKTLQSQNSILAPIFVHFIFNLVFYFAVTSGLLL